MEAMDLSVERRRQTLLPEGACNKIVETVDLEDLPNFTKRRFRRSSSVIVPGGFRPKIHDGQEHQQYDHPDP
jgi:hypothetical protein